ncbi:unnamed protein product [Linum tenue]|uniref:Tryptophan synthase beta chain-like PALP domain-containing protein n=1 Tax=Linum tenue TaxID=586396 RepID=A0AAV0PZ43_9ROSI|nr:unnamed protein product [Linum tenue]
MLNLQFTTSLRKDRNLAPDELFLQYGLRLELVLLADSTILALTLKDGTTESGKGAFKFRGACNAVYSLDDEQAAKGVVTHSSGNHAAALALAAKLRGISSYIVIPKNAPKCKVENVLRYGGQVIWSENTMQAREDTASRVLEETGAVLLHPFNDGRIISGQGTISLELLEQVTHLDTLVVPISGLFNNLGVFVD